MSPTDEQDQQKHFYRSCPAHNLPLDGLTCPVGPHVPCDGEDDEPAWDVRVAGTDAFVGHVNAYGVTWGRVVFEGGRALIGRNREGLTGQREKGRRAEDRRPRPAPQPVMVARRVSAPVLGPKRKNWLTRELCLQALEESGQSAAAAARRLGCSIPGLWHALKRWGIQRPPRIHRSVA